MRLLTLYVSLLKLLARYLIHVFLSGPLYRALCYKEMPVPWSITALARAAMLMMWVVTEIYFPRIDPYRLFRWGLCSWDGGMKTGSLCSEGI